MIVPEQPLTPEDMPNIYSDEVMRCRCGNAMEALGYFTCADCRIPKCEAIGCTEPRAEHDEADSCILHNYQAALEDLRDLGYCGQTQYRVYRWRMACEKAGISLEEVVRAD